MTVTLVEGFFGFATEKKLLADRSEGWINGRSLRVMLLGNPGSKTSMGTLMQCVNKHSSCFSLGPSNQSMEFALLLGSKLHAT